MLQRGNGNREVLQHENSIADSMLIRHVLKKNVINHQLITRLCYNKYDDIFFFTSSRKVEKRKYI